MVYPVSSGFTQSIPASNTFQPGGIKPEENRLQDTTRPVGTETARAESSNTRSNNRVEASKSYQLAYEDVRSKDNGSAASSTSRGTQLDLTA